MQRGTIRRRPDSPDADNDDSARPTQRLRPSSPTPLAQQSPHTEAPPTSMTVTTPDALHHSMGAQATFNGVSNNGLSNGVAPEPAVPDSPDGPFTVPSVVLDRIRPYHPPGSLMYSDDQDWRPDQPADIDVPMDGSIVPESEDPVASSSRKLEFGKRMPVNREEVVRLMLQGLNDMGYSQAAQVLSKESGYTLASRAAIDFQAAIAGGRWAEAEALLPDMGITATARIASSRSSCASGSAPTKDEFERPVDRAKFLIARQKYLEHLEAGQQKKALTVLRTELRQSGCAPDALHDLSSYMMCSDREDLYARAEWDGAAGISRRLLLERLQEDISPRVMVPSRRLASLLDQARQHQQQSCLYHDDGGPISLYNDHQCVSGSFPSVTTHVLADHTDEVWRIEWSPDGNMLASASKDRTAVIWQLKPPQAGSTQYSMVPLHQLKGHRHAVDCIAWSPDGEILVTASDKQVYLWDTKTGARKVTDSDNSPHTDTISAIQWLPDGSQFVAASMDTSVVFYDRNGSFVHTWTIKDNIQVLDLCITPDGSRIVAATRYLRRVPDQNKLKPAISVRDETVKASGDVNFAQMEYGLAVMRIAEKDIVDFISDIKTTQVTSLRLSHDGKRVLVSCQPDELQMFALEPHLHLTRKFVGHVQSRFLIRSAFGAPKDRFILSGSEDGHVYVWQSNATAPIEVLSGHRDTVNAVAWNPVLSRKLFASCSDDTQIRIWQPPVHDEGAGDAEGMEL